MLLPQTKVRCSPWSTPHPHPRPLAARGIEDRLAALRHEALTLKIWVDPLRKVENVFPVERPHGEA